MSIIVSNKSRKFISNFIGKHINSPEQRLIQGIAALGIQPVIDYNNRKADDETRAVSVARTIGKIVAGTAVGVLVRYLAIGAAKNFSAYTIMELENNFVKKVVPKSKKDFLMPELNFAIPSKTAKEFKQMHTNFIKAMGTLLATFAMVFTNFLIDAPLTGIITKKLTPYMKEKIAKDSKLTEEKRNG